MQTALRAALAGVAGVSGVFDAVPVEAAAPYLTIGPDACSDWSTKTKAGREHRVLVEVWDDRASYARTKDLLARVEAAVLPLGGNAGGWRVAHVLFVRSFVTRDPDGWTHGVADFRIRTEEI